MRLLRTILGLVFLAPEHVFAQVPSVPSVMGVCGTAPTLSCLGGGAGGAAAFVLRTVIPALQYIFYAVAIGFFFYYAARLMIESEDESTITETKSAYGYAISGAIIVSLADNILRAVGIGFATSTLVNPAPVNEGLHNTVLFIRLCISAAASGMITYQGMRMILLQGQESEMDQQKKRFFHGLIGVAVVLLANVVVEAFLPGTGSNVLADQIVGIINFILQLFGALVVLAFIVAGTMMIIATDDALKDRAKKSVFGTIISMVIVLVSYTLINFTIHVTI